MRTEKGKYAQLERYRFDIKRWVVVVSVAVARVQEFFDLLGLRGPVSALVEIDWLKVMRRFDRDISLMNRSTTPRSFDTSHLQRRLLFSPPC